MNVHFSPVFDRIQTPVQIEKRERHALIPRRRHTRRRHTRHTRPGCCCCCCCWCLFLGCCSHLYSSPVSYNIVFSSYHYVAFTRPRLCCFKIFLFFFSFLFLCPHTKAHTQRRGPRLIRGGARARERERFCVRVFFVCKCIPL